MFTTNPVLLKNLLDRVQEGKIQLPDFQRGWVWDDYRIKSLLASISRSFPVGAVMTLSSGSDIKFRTRPIEGVNGNITGAPDSFLLDGQQRLTSLYQALRHPCPVDTHDDRGQRIKRCYYIDMKAALDPSIDREDAIISVPENRKVTEDFGRNTVLDLSTPELEYERHMIPTEALMDGMDWGFRYAQFWQGHNESHPEEDAFQFFNKFKQLVLDSFTDYQLPVIDLGKDTPKEAVCVVFEKVNTGGVTLSVFELATASFAADAESFSLRDDWEVRKQRMDSFGALHGIQGDQFLQAVALLKTQEERRQAMSKGTPSAQAPGIGCKKRDILDLELKDYQRWADEVESGFIDAAKFLRTQFVFGQRNVPYTTQLVPMAALYVELGNELNTGIAMSRLERWFWSGIFGEVYGGTTETQFSLDLAQVAEYVRDGTPPTLVTQANFIPERLLTLRTRNSAAYKGLYALQMKSGASDWITGKPLSIADLHNENIDIHHIFPKAWCQDAKPAIPARIYDSVINKTPIDASTNKVIGRRAPSCYLPRLRQKMTPEKLDRVLEAHWLDPHTLERDNFAQSFVERGEAMLRLIGNAMGRDLGSGREVLENALMSAGVITASEVYASTGIELYTDLFDDEREYGDLGDADLMDEQQAADD